MSEELFPIPGHEGYFANREGTRFVGPGRWHPHDLTIGYWGERYLCVQIGKKKWKIHHLMALTFIGPRPPGAEVRHLDDDKTHNNAENIAYGTRMENTADAIANGIHVSLMHKAKTQCPKRHEYTPENTYYYTRKDGGINRHCKTCKVDGVREWRQRQRR